MLGPYPPLLSAAIAGLNIFLYTGGSIMESVACSDTPWIGKAIEPTMLDINLTEAVSTSDLACIAFWGETTLC
jgi:hypothetical protein